MSGENASSSSNTPKGLEDLQYLLYLATLKRFRDDDANIRRQVEERYRQYSEAKREYEEMYAKYVRLVELARTRCVLEKENHLDELQVEKAKANVAFATQKLASNIVVDYLNPSTVEQCQQHLASYQPNAKLKDLKQQLEEKKAAVRAIQLSTEAIETKLDSAAVQGLDHFVSEMQPHPGQA